VAQSRQGVSLHRNPGSIKTDLVQGTIVLLPIMCHFSAGSGHGEGFLHALLDVALLHVPCAYCGVTAVAGGQGLGAFDPMMAMVTTPEHLPLKVMGGSSSDPSTGRQRKGWWWVLQGGSL